MNQLPPGLLQGLTRSRLLPRQAQPTSGVGERRSRIKGPGMEFEDYRAYQPGDNMRHLDHNVYMRTGRHYIREYASYRQLDVKILLDASESMRHGQPEKLQFARAVAHGLAFVALAGGDRLQLGVLGDRTRWSEPLQGVQRLPLVEERLAAAQNETGSCASLEQALSGSLPAAAGECLLIIVSDFMMDDVPAAFRRLAGRGMEPAAVQVLAPEEEDPRLLGGGASLLIDAEAGDAFEISLGSETLERYEVQLRSWRDELRQSAGAAGGRFLSVSSAAPLDSLFLREWRSAGLIG